MQQPKRFLLEVKNYKFLPAEHLEYDATTLGDEYQRDVAAGLKTALPENYYPNDDPTLPPINNWRPFAFLLMANWINDLYQATPFDLTSLGKT